MLNGLASLDPSENRVSDVTLLGPQRGRPTASRVARSLEGPLAAITAGWQENENDSLPRGLNKKSTNLGIYRRAERVFDEDRELFEAHRERQLRLKQLQALYRVRLDHAIAAFRELVEIEGKARARPLNGQPTGEEVAAEGGASASDESIEGEVGAAMEAVRALDSHHLERVRSVHAAFEAAWQPSTRPAVVRQREELVRELEAVETVIVAGGHVAVLLNRMRLFDLAPLLAGKTMVAWSAGAMVLSPRIVLFHDSPPWGAGNAEVLDVGLDLFGQLLPLPDARRRLRTSDPRRVEILARRFAPLTCLGLDEHSLVCRDTDGWRGRGLCLLDVEGGARWVGASTWEDLAP